MDIRRQQEVAGFLHGFSNYPGDRTFDDCMEGAKELLRREEKIRALIDRWKVEAAERGDNDKLYTNGVVTLLENALKD